MRDLIKDLVKYAPAVLLPALVGLLEIPVLTRFFPAERYGQYVLVVTVVQVLIIFVGWLYMAIIRVYPACEKDGTLEALYGSVMASLVIWVLVLAAGFLAVTVLLRRRLGSDVYHLMLIGVAVFVLLAFFQAFQMLLQAQRQIGWFGFFAGWHALGRLLLGVLLVVSLSLGVEGFLWGYAIAVGLACPLMWYLTSRRASFGWRVSAPLVRAMIAYGAPLAVGNLLDWVVNLSNVYFLEFFRGTQEVGIYSASSVLATKGLLLITGIFLIAARPLEMRIWEGGDLDESQGHASLTTRYYLLVSLPFGVLAAVLARPAIGIMTTSQYHEGARIVPFVVAGSLLLGLAQRYQVGLLFHNKTRVLMVCFLLSGLVSLALNFVLVPRYGILGAAVTVLISYLVLLVLTVHRSRRYFTFSFPWPALGRALLAAAGMGGVLYQVNRIFAGSQLANLAVGAALGLGCYAVILLALGELQPDEKKAVRDFVARLGGQASR